MKFSDIKRMTRAKYNINVPWRYLERTLEGYREDFRLNMNPDFKRAHSWTPKQKTRFIEWVFRGGKNGLDIFFNYPNWMKCRREDSTTEMVIVDGKQRLCAVLDFLHDRIPVYGCLYSEYEDRLSVTGVSFTFHINDLTDRKDILQWYIDMNTGGTIHSEEEIERVRSLLEAENEKGRKAEVVVFTRKHSESSAEFS